MAGVQTTAETPEDLPGWYYAQIDALGLDRTDAASIYRTRAGILRCVFVQAPDADWTRERAQEQIDFIKADLDRPRR